MVTRGGRLHWEEDRDFDLDHHVVATALPPPGDETAARRLFGEFLSRPLDPSRPLWQLHVIDKFQGGSALLARIHHALGDGVAMMLVLLSLCDVEPESPPADGPVAATPSPLSDLFGNTAERFAAFRRFADEVMPDTMRLVLHPVEVLRRTSRVLIAGASTGALGRLLAYPPDSRTPFKGPLVLEKRAAWSRPLALDDVKTVGRALGGTVNDVLLSAVAGALRRYLARDEAPREDLVVRAAMPVNLRPLEHMSALGNRFGVVFLGIPIGIGDPLRRTAELKRRADALKRSAEPVVVYRILDAMGRVPLAVQRLVVRIFGAKATAVMTNVPGPRKTLYFAGRPMEDIFFWVPQSGHLGLGISIMTYRGRVRLAFGTDAGLVPDPSLLVEGFHDEWTAMAEIARGRASVRQTDSPPK